MKIKKVSLIILIGAGLVGVTFARGGCFLSGTIIQTPFGEKNIQDLTGGDEVLSYNFEKNKIENSKIERVDILQREGYFLLNNTTKVTAEHPFYVKSGDQNIIKLVKDLATGDKLIGLKGEKILNTKNYITGESTVYNLINVSPNNNYFANGMLVHNKGGGGGGGGSSHSSSRSSRTGPCYQTYNAAYNTPACISQRKRDTFFSYFGFLVYPIVLLYTYLSKLSLSKKDFTKDQNLIAFTKSINPDFSNKYDMKYSRDDQNRSQKPLETELLESEYFNIISKNELISQVQKIFFDYQKDWSTKNRENMKTYTTDYFFEKQKGIFVSSFGSGYDIVYNPRLDGISIDHIENHDGQNIIGVQINASMINFGLNMIGKVITGDDTQKSFTEQWYFVINSDKKVLLQEIIS